MISSNTQDLLAKESEFIKYFDSAFCKFLQMNLRKQKILSANKAVLLEQCRNKIKIEDILSMTANEVEDKIVQALNKIVYSCAYIPEGLIGTSDDLEADILDPESGEVSDFNALARNIFRYIERGTEVDCKRQDIKKGLALVEKVLTEKRDPKLLNALREEFQKILTKIASRLVKIPNKENDIAKNPLVSEDDEKQYEVLISNLLAAYTFLDPYIHKTLWVPQKIAGLGWRNIAYRVEPLDLSPQSGLLSKLIQDEDRIYAYGMTPIDPQSQAQRQLLLMGTTYPSGQGAALSNLHKFDPKHSVGEAYDWNKVGQWINSQDTKIKVTGHSQGGASAMFVAGSYPERIAQADCLNTPALCTETLNRLNPKWAKIPKQNRPIIHVYAQQGDPVYPIENGFLDGTRIFRIISGVEKCSNLNPLLPTFFQKTLEAHLHHFSGRESSLMLELDLEQEHFTHSREFFADMKGTLNQVLYPFLYADLVVGFTLRNAKLWCLENIPNAVNTSLAVAGFIPFYALKLAINITLLVVQATLLAATLLLTAIYAGIKIGIKSALGLSHKPQLNEKIEPAESMSLA